MKIEVVQIITIAEHSRIKSASAEFEVKGSIHLAEPDQCDQITDFARALFDSFKSDEQKTKPE